MDYDFTSIERKWQAWWAENKTYKAVEDPSRPKYYVLDMFPYPSGAGLHVGHPLGYIASDIAYIVNDAAMTAAFTHSMITQEMLEQSVRDTKPSVSGEAMEMYDELQEKMAGLERQNMTIGYKQR